MLTEIRCAEQKTYHSFTDLSGNLIACKCGSILFYYTDKHKVVCSSCYKPHVVIVDKGA